MEKNFSSKFTYETVRIRGDREGSKRRRKTHFSTVHKQTREHRERPDLCLNETEIDATPLFLSPAPKTATPRVWP